MESFVIHGAAEFVVNQHVLCSAQPRRRVSGYKSAVTAGCRDERVSHGGGQNAERLQLVVDEAARSGDLQTTIEYASRLAEPDTRYSCGTSSASGIRVTEGGGGLGTGREGSFSLLFLSTAAVWCVPSSVPSVYSTNYKRKEKVLGSETRWYALAAAPA